jgi:hypothetical protein
VVAITFHRAFGCADRTTQLQRASRTCRILIRGFTLRAQLTYDARVFRRARKITAAFVWVVSATTATVAISLALRRKFPALQLLLLVSLNQHDLFLSKKNAALFQEWRSIAAASMERRI